MKSKVLATVDVAIKLRSLRNLLNILISDVGIRISINSSQFEATPYQIISEKKSKSKVNFQYYMSSTFTLKSQERIPVDEIVIFKMHLPVYMIERAELSYKFELLSLGEEEVVVLAQYVGTHNCLIGINSFIPCLFRNQFIGLDAAVYTSILNIRKMGTFVESKKQLHTCIDSMTTSYNKIRQKLTQDAEKFEKQVDLPKFQGYTQICKYLQARIFKSKENDEASLKKLNDFIDMFIPEMNAKLHMIWNTFMKQQLPLTMHSLRKSYLNQLGKAIHEKVYKEKSLGKGPKSVVINTLKMDSPKINLNMSMEWEKDPFFVESDGMHLVVLVQGFGSSYNSITILQQTLRYMFPNVTVMNSKINEEIDDKVGVWVMGRNLSVEVDEFIKAGSYNDKLQLSFIGHSLGGLIVRAALPHLQKYKPYFRNFITLGSPHLGYLYYLHPLVKLLLVSVESLTSSEVLRTLLMKDRESQPRKSFLYELSTYEGLGWFKQILLIGSSSDRFTPLLSALIASDEKISSQSEEGKEIGKLWMEMMLNISASIGKGMAKARKISVDFHKIEKEEKMRDAFDGYTSDMRYLESQDFLDALILGNQELFI